jgi:hypothetical protein
MSEWKKKFDDAAFDVESWLAEEKLAAIVEIEAEMRDVVVPEELKGMSMAQIYERLTTVKDKA